MAYTGLDTDQRAHVEDACVSLLNRLADELAQDGDTVEDTHLRAVEILTLMLGVLDEDRTERVVALRWPSREGGPVPFKRIGPAASLGRGGPERRWADLVDRRAASAAPSWYTPRTAAATAAHPAS